MPFLYAGILAAGANLLLFSMIEAIPGGQRFQQVQCTLCFLFLVSYLEDGFMNHAR